jgi:hypothetical protein
MTWMGHVAHTGEGRGPYRNQEDPGVHERIILKWIFKEWDGRQALTGLIWLKIGTGSGPL